MKHSVYEEILHKANKHRRAYDRTAPRWYYRHWAVDAFRWSLATYKEAKGFRPTEEAAFKSVKSQALLAKRIREERRLAGHKRY